ncbi:hypothetical protein Taro_015297 [Colocasia esculenta]|uniref:Uncharacterized protein n=1 Tax=Colocasia esculenta TaxID=4460 RepID=A0A843UGZ6_COLES|nr:hypothetical protein [Colocasia esculenta]
MGRGGVGERERERLTGYGNGDRMLDGGVVAGCSASDDDRRRVSGYGRGSSEMAADGFDRREGKKRRGEMGEDGFNRREDSPPIPNTTHPPNFSYINPAPSTILLLPVPNRANPISSSSSSGLLRLLLSKSPPSSPAGGVLPGAIAGTMSTSVDPLVVGRVIGEVIDLFVPTVSMSVKYGSKHVNNGCDVKPSMATNPPAVAIGGHPTDLYTLVMTDPDAPSPSDPTMREWVHWIVVDIPGGTNPYHGREVLQYMPPRPPVGIHRYVFVLFRQGGPFPQIAPPAQRSNFSTRAFAAQFDLGLPVATVYHNSQKEPAHRRR